MAFSSQHAGLNAFLEHLRGGQGPLLPLTNDTRISNADGNQLLALLPSLDLRDTSNETICPLVDGILHGQVSKMGESQNEIHNLAFNSFKDRLGGIWASESSVSTRPPTY